MNNRKISCINKNMLPLEQTGSLSSVSDTEKHFLKELLYMFAVKFLIYIIVCKYNICCTADCS